MIWATVSSWSSITIINNVVVNIFNHASLHTYVSFSLGFTKKISTWLLIDRYASFVLYSISPKWCYNVNSFSITNVMVPWLSKDMLHVVEFFYICWGLFYDSGCGLSWSTVHEHLKKVVLNSVGPTLCFFFFLSNSVFKWLKELWMLPLRN